MPENYALYSHTYEELPDAEMQRLGGQVRPSSGITERGLTYTYTWPDLTILVNALPREEMPEHLKGFVGYIRHIYGENIPRRGEKIIAQILRTRLVVGIEIQPGRDTEGRTEHLVGSMCGGLHPIMFHADALFDWMSRLLLAPNGHFDPAAEIGPPRKWWQFWK
jgi:hypothetical protein